MIFINYYNEIKNVLIRNVAYKKVKDYSKNKGDLMSYFEVGRLIVEAQGGEDKAKYGNKLIKEYSQKLTADLGKGYDVTNLRHMRAFFLKFRKQDALRPELSWTHYRTLLPLKSENEIKYYVDIIITQNLSYRELKNRIKSHEYERIGYKEELEEPKVNTLIKNPIIIKMNNFIKNEVTEKILHELILEDISGFLKELGIGFCFISHEYKVKIGSIYHYIDFLLFNIKFNCYVVVEIKITEMKPEYIGQVMKYINYIDKNVKELHNDRTIGVVICRHDNKYVMEYCTDERIFTTTYKLHSN